MSNQWVDFGNLMTKKGETKKYYFQIKEGLTVKITGKNFRGDAIDVTLKGGDYINVADPQDEHNRLCAMGKITEEQRDERLAKIPAFIKKVFKIAPKD